MINNIAALDFAIVLKAVVIEVIKVSNVHFNKVDSKPEKSIIDSVIDQIIVFKDSELDRKVPQPDIIDGNWVYKDQEKDCGLDRHGKNNGDQHRVSMSNETKIG